MTNATEWDMTDATAQALCDLEDGDTDAVQAFLDAATHAEKVVFTDEVNRTTRLPR